MTAKKKTAKKKTAKKKTAKKKTAKKKTAKKKPKTERTLRIRMYGVGFGDAFLLVLPGDRTVLVDAGFHSQGKGFFAGRELAQQVIADVEALTGAKRIDVVVATHRHQDHVYSFNAADWDEVEVGEVWLPWVEDLSKPEIRKLWKKQKAFALALAAAAPRLALTPEQRTELDFLLWNAGCDVGPASDDPVLRALYAAWSNAAALDRLRDGFATRERREPRYLPESQVAVETFETSVLPGVRVHVLGPPRDPELLAHLDPATDDETYRAFAMAAAAPAGETAEASPFADAWIEKDVAPESLFAPRELDRLESLAGSGDALFAARALDGMINSTSLVLLLQIGSARLLLPGDAEWGTWKLILADERAVSLLEGTTFLKVGHHGSHNATPKTLVEEVLSDELHAMISTQEGPGNYRNDIPLPALIAALAQKNIHAVRSDDDDADLPDGYTRGPDGRWIELELPC